jgi:hypothetical protein
MNYLYNGVNLPATPAVDEAHRHLFITHGVVGGKPVANFHATTTPVYFRKATNGEIYAQTDGNEIRYSMNGTKGETDWVYRETVDYASGDKLADDNTLSFLWTNTDIYNEDGKTLYLAASEPVPPLNHAALMQGFATMLSLKK